MAASRRNSGTAQRAKPSRAGRAARRRAAAVGQAETSRPRSTRQRFGRGMLRDSMAELRRVTWPSRAQVRSLTMMVVAVAAAMGFALGGTDWVFSRLAAVIIGSG